MVLYLKSFFLSAASSDLCSGLPRCRCPWQLQRSGQPWAGKLPSDAALVQACNGAHAGKADAMTSKLLVRAGAKKVLSHAG
jgi:hypothetical protein